MVRTMRSGWRWEFSGTELNLSSAVFYTNSRGLKMTREGLIPVDSVFGFGTVRTSTDEGAGV